MQFQQKAKHRKKLGSMKRLRKFLITIGDKFPFHVTIVITTRADGTAHVPPQIIHAGKRINPNVLEGLNPEFGFHISPSGSQDRVGFERWCTTFVKHSRKGKSAKRKTFLYLDGHNSRWTYTGAPQQQALTALLF